LTLPGGVKKWAKQIESVGWVRGQDLIDSDCQVSNLLSNLLEIPPFKAFALGELKPDTALREASSDPPRREDILSGTLGKGGLGGSTKGTGGKGGRGKGHSSKKGGGEGKRKGQKPDEYSAATAMPPVSCANSGMYGGGCGASQVFPGMPGCMMQAPFPAACNVVGPCGAGGPCNACSPVNSCLDINTNGSVGPDTMYTAGTGMPMMPPMVAYDQGNASEMQRQMFGEQLYLMIQPLAPSPSLAQKITGMLLELPQNELLLNLTNIEELRQRVAEALELLREDGVAC